MFPFKTSKELSESTTKVYKAKMNKLYKMNFKTLEDLVDRPEELVKSIEVLASKFSDEELKRREARVIYSAVFAVLHGHEYLSNKDNSLRQAFHRYDPLQFQKDEKTVAWKGIDSL